VFDRCARLVEASCCQFAETYERAGRLNDDVGLRSVTIVYSLLLHHRRCHSDGRTVKWYSRHIPHKQIVALSLNFRNGHET